MYYVTNYMDTLLTHSLHDKDRVTSIADSKYAWIPFSSAIRLSPLFSFNFTSLQIEQ